MDNWTSSELWYRGQRHSPCSYHVRSVLHLRLRPQCWGLSWLATVMMHKDVSWWPSQHHNSSHSSDDTFLRPRPHLHQHRLTKTQPDPNLRHKDTITPYEASMNTCHNYDPDLSDDWSQVCPQHCGDSGLNMTLLSFNTDKADRRNTNKESQC